MGIDAGGTKTVCYLAGADARLVAQSHGPGANLHAVGELAVENVLHGVMDDVLRDRSIVPSVICLGMAGVDRRADADIIQRIMRRIGYNARIVVTNDALVALVAGVDDEPGVVIVAGTGSVAYGRDASGKAARAGGWGYILGDEGGGYWIGRHALRAVLRQADGRGPTTSLTPRILKYFGVARPGELIHAVYGETLNPARIAAVAPLVQAATDEGDAVATRILDTASAELVACATSVVAQLAMRETAFTLVLAGGIFKSMPALVRLVAGSLTSACPLATLLELNREPAHGAVRIALAALKGAAPIPVYRTP